MIFKALATAGVFLYIEKTQTDVASDTRVYTWYICPLTVRKRRCVSLATASDEIAGVNTHCKKSR